MSENKDIPFGREASKEEELELENRLWHYRAHFFEKMSFYFLGVLVGIIVYAFFLRGD